MSTLIRIGKLPSFSDAISLLKYGRISRMDTSELVAILSNLAFHYNETTITEKTTSFSNNKFISSQFKGKDPYDFLTIPLRSDRLLFKTPAAQSCILNLFALDKAKLYNFFFRIDSFISNYDYSNLNELIDYYDEKFANTAKLDIEESTELTELEKKRLISFFDTYIGFIRSKSYEMNAKMILLFALINGEAIHLLEAIKSMVKFSEERSQFRTNTKFVIQSAMGNNLFIGADNTYEPMNGEDTQIIKRTVLYSLSRDMLDTINSVFEFEEASEEENRESDNITDYGHRKLPVLGENFSLADGMKVLLATGETMRTLVKGKGFNKKKYYIKVGDRYLRFVDWHTESRLLLGKKCKRARWYIHQNDDKSIVITPSGGLQYYGFCIDIPNATQHTYRIPMWLFFKNGTKAQKFYLHEVIE